MTTLAFDVYGTLIDTHGIRSTLEVLVGEHADKFSKTWRDKQLEYSFRKGLMRQYEPFTICTRQALDYTCSFYGVNLQEEQINELMSRYKMLPAFTDVQKVLRQLKTAGFRLYAFSNGEQDVLEMLLANAKIRDLFQGIVSVDGIQSFKPNPDVYHYFLRQSGAEKDNAWLISCNSFDVLGAMSVGMKAAWVQRLQSNVFDPWGLNPTLTVSDLKEFYRKITPE